MTDIALEGNSSAGREKVFVSFLSPVSGPVTDGTMTQQNECQV